MSPVRVQAFKRHHHHHNHHYLHSRVSTHRQGAVDDAVSAIEDLESRDCADAAVLLRLLRDNLALWTVRPATPARPVESIYATSSF